MAPIFFFFFMYNVADTHECISKISYISTVYVVLEISIHGILQMVSLE